MVGGAGYGPELLGASEPDRGVYELTFRYTGPGINICTWPTDAQEWDCFGYY